MHPYNLRCCSTKYFRRSVYVALVGIATPAAQHLDEMVREASCSSGSCSANPVAVADVPMGVKPGKAKKALSHLRHVSVG